MWTFDNPPLEYFQQAYGFRPDSAWLARARLGALRFADYCSASFVSPNGLLLTNHHCSVDNLAAVTMSGERLDSAGFYAATQADERRVPGLFVEQLESITDVTSAVDSAVRGITGDAEIAAARDEAIQAIGERMTTAGGGEAAGIRVEIVTLYSGGIYSAYTYRRYSDVRLVLAPELAIAFFGGDPDNFTYPRYDLDFTFYRVYDDQGQPLKSTNYFPWTSRGAVAGDPVFVVGNPGSTSRLVTVAQLEYNRDAWLPFVLYLYGSRIGVFETFTQEQPTEAARLHLRNLVFDLANAEKANQGQLSGLRDPNLMGRRARGEADFRAALLARPSLASGAGLIDSIAALQPELEQSLGPSRALLTNAALNSATLVRATLAARYAALKAAGAPPEAVQDLAARALAVSDRPSALERLLLAAQFRDLQHGFGDQDTLVVAVLAGRTPDAAAADLLAHSVLPDSARFAALLAGNVSGSSDPAIALAERILRVVLPAQRQVGELTDREDNLAARLARYRFDVYGKSLPPDATFTLRLADGLVKGYPYNGTEAQPFTNFFGLYERYYASGQRAPWNLPPRWATPPVNFELATPFNLVTTNDIIGGNSGSPLLNRNLELVGLVFDGNIESLPNEFIYTDEQARAVSVDARAILTAIGTVYGATRIVDELRGH